MARFFASLGTELQSVTQRLSRASRVLLGACGSPNHLAPVSLLDGAHMAIERGAAASSQKQERLSCMQSCGLARGGWGGGG